MRVPSCRSCTRVGTGEGFPDGWYHLTVNDPEAPNGKYRYLGLFCSIVCLSNHLPEMERIESDIRYRWELRHGLR